MIQMKMDSFIR